MTTMEWLFAVGIFGGAWFLGTGLASIDTEDHFKNQFRFVASLITGPAHWFVGLVAAPATMIKGYWAHKERMHQITTNAELSKRIDVLEDITIDRN